MRGEPAQFPFVRNEDAFLDGLPFEVLQVGDFTALFAIPEDQRALGEVELGGDARQAPALHAQFEETMSGFLIFHKSIKRSVLRASKRTFSVRRHRWPHRGL